MIGTIRKRRSKKRVANLNLHYNSLAAAGDHGVRVYMDYHGDNGLEGHHGHRVTSPTGHTTIATTHSISKSQNKGFFI